MHVCIKGLVQHNISCLHHTCAACWYALNEHTRLCSTQIDVLRMQEQCQDIFMHVSPMFTIDVAFAGSVPIMDLLVQDLLDYSRKHNSEVSEPVATWVHTDDMAISVFVVWRMQSNSSRG
jgi:hypothetical protein